MILRHLHKELPTVYWKDVDLAVDGIQSFPSSSQPMVHPYLTLGGTNLCDCYTHFLVSHTPTLHHIR